MATEDDAAATRSGGVEHDEILPSASRRSFPSRSVAKWIGGSLLVLVLIGGAAYLLYSPVQQLISSTRFFGLEQIDSNSAWQTPAGQELTSAAAHHFFIAVPISKCFPDADITKSNVSLTVMGSLMLGLQPLGNQQWERRGNLQTEDPEPTIKLNNYQLSALMLSDAISRARMQFAEGAAGNKARMELYQWALVILGALTTILISMKSISNERTPGFVLLGVLAIIFSAWGTACSSMISFYTPSDAFVRNERALVQIRQLHTDLGLAVSGSPDVCAPAKGDADDPRMKSLKDLSTRLTEIVSASGTSGQPGQNTGASTGQTGPTK